MSPKHIETLHVIVGGPFSSGKTSFIRSLSEIEPDNVTIEGVIRDQKVSYSTCTGRLTLDNEIKAHLYEIPGGRRVSDFVETVQAMGANSGAIILIDSAKPITFREAGRLIEYFDASNALPYVIAANKQDLPDALSPDGLRAELSISDDIPIIPCIATDKESVKRVVLALLEKVREEIEDRE